MEVLGCVLARRASCWGPSVQEEARQAGKHPIEAGAEPRRRRLRRGSG
jgi:hypothetical protein